MPMSFFRKVVRTAAALFRPPYRRWTMLAVVAALLYYGWGQVTRTRGAQKVAFRPAAKQCGTIDKLRYCIYRDRRGTSKDVLFHLHARNLDEQIWNDDTYLTTMIQSEWQRSGVLPPTVVSLSYGPTWLLAPKGQKADSGLLEDMMSRLPKIEAKLGVPRRRMLMGESMGGLNVLVAGLTYPQQFAKVAALCPGVYKISPFAPFSEMREAAYRTGADPKIGVSVLMWSRKHVANEAEWHRMSPLALIEKAGPDYPALYISNGLYDGFGNFEGSEQLAKEALKRGVKTEWRPLYGGHCATDASSLASFLVAP
jgi:hypothetical protein